MKTLSVIFFCLVLSQWSHASGIDVAKLRFPVTKKVLPNGLTILFHEDHSAPTVSYQTWFRVGSRDEALGYSGIAHLFEHMMFKGAKRYSGKDFDRILKTNGVSNNAFTSHDYTGYFEELPSSKLKLIIDIESDRLENLQLTPENLKSERDVVKEERRFRVDNSIHGSMAEALFSTAYEVHPYRWPVVGWMNDLNNIDLQRCKDFFKMFYSASNAVIGVVGDFNSEEAFKLIEKYYGHLPKVEVLRNKIDSEPVQNKEKKVSIEKVTPAERVLIGYHIGKQGEQSSYVMDLISNILAEGDSSRLFKKLVYSSQMASQVEGGSYTPKDPGIFQIFIEVKPGVSNDKVTALALQEVERMGRERVSPRELEKAKNQIMKQWVDSVKTIHGKARMLMLNEIVTGSFESLFDDLEKYNKVTIDDIQKVASQFLKKTNRTIVNLTPKKEAKL